MNTETQQIPEPHPAANPIPVCLRGKPEGTVFYYLTNYGHRDIHRAVLFGNIDGDRRWKAQRTSTRQIIVINEGRFRKYIFGLSREELEPLRFTA